MALEAGGGGAGDMMGDSSNTSFQYLKHGASGGAGTVWNESIDLPDAARTGRAGAGARGGVFGMGQEDPLYHRRSICWQVAWVVVRPLYLKMGGTLAQGRLWYSSGGYGVARARVGGVGSGAGRAPVAMGRDGMPTLVVQTWGARKQAAYSASDP